jgi:NADH-quinone oxidoreductase subunit L
MFLACGVGAFIAAIFHVMTHAFFKALLFLGSGSVIHGMHHEQDMRKMGGLKKYLPITFATMFAGWLAICGIFPFAGFFSKDEILFKTFSAAGLPQGWNTFLWVIGLITAIMTAAYMTRLMIMTFWGDERFGKESAADSHDSHHQGHDFKPHESPWTMTVPLIALAILSAFGGLVGIPYAVSSLLGGGDVNVFERTLEPVIAHVGAKSETHVPQLKESVAGGIESVAVNSEHGETMEHSSAELNLERGLALLSFVLAGFGIAAGFWLFGKTPLRKISSLFENKWYLDEIYNSAIVDPITKLSRNFLWKGFDLGFIDGIVNGIGNFVIEAARGVRQLQVGFVRSYAAMIVLGALFVVGYFIYYGIKLIG